MTTHKSLCLPFIFFIIFSLHSQNEQKYFEEWNAKIDTIQNLDIQVKFSIDFISKVKPEDRIDIYSFLGNVYGRKLQMDSAIYYLDKAISLSKNTGEEEKLAFVYSRKSNIHIAKNEFEKTRNLLEKARKLLIKYPESASWSLYYQQLSQLGYIDGDLHQAVSYMDSTIIARIRSNDTLELYDSYDKLGFLCSNLGEYERAITSLSKALNMLERIDDKGGIADNYISMGQCYNLWGQYETAKGYLEKAIVIAKKNGYDLRLLRSYVCLSESNRHLGHPEDAISAANSALKLAQKHGSESRISRSFREKGETYLYNYQNYNKAEEYFIKAYEALKNTKTKFHRIPSIQGIVKVYHKKKNYAKVKGYLNLWEESIKESGRPKDLMDFYKSYSEYYEVTNQPKKEVYYLKKYYKIQDSISKEKVYSKLASLEKKYDTKKKELDIVNLNQEKEEQKQIAQQAKAQQNLYLLAAGSLFFLLVAGAWAFRKLRKQQKELATTNQVKNRLFSIIAHDLRGMIIPFQRSGKILKYHIGKGNHEKTIELSQEIEKNSESLSNMLDNLLNWSLEQMNGYKMNPEQISIGKELKGIIKSYEQEAAFKNTNINLKYEEDIAIKFDKGAFHVIFRNLISNALKYTENGNIRIEFKRDFNTLLCSMIDTGVGMSKEQLQNVFTFEEGKTTVGTQGEKGTGIGLNLVFRFVKMHKGSIKVSSEKRIGTRFDLTFPKLEPLTTDHSDDLESMSA